MESDKTLRMILEQKETNDKENEKLHIASIDEILDIFEPVEISSAPSTAEVVLSFDNSKIHFSSYSKILFPN